MFFQNFMDAMELMEGQQPAEELIRNLYKAIAIMESSKAPAGYAHLKTNMVKHFGAIIKSIEIMEKGDEETGNMLKETAETAMQITIGEVEKLMRLLFPAQEEDKAQKAGGKVLKGVVLTAFFMSLGLLFFILEIPVMGVIFGITGIFFWIRTVKGRKKNKQEQEDMR